MAVDDRPTFIGLLRANLKVAAAMLVFGLAAFYGWRLLQALFPDLTWLRVPGR